MLKRVNLAIFILPIMIFSLGFVTLLSTATLLVKSHVVNFLFGYILLIVFSRIDYRVYKFIWKYLLLLAVILLAVTLLFADIKAGSARWLQIADFSFQTSEFAKLAIIICLSAFLTTHAENINRPRTILQTLLYVLPPVILIYLQPDLGTSLVVLGVYFGLIFFAGIKKIYFAFAFIIFGVFSAPIWNILKEYQKQRILIFLNPTADVLGSGYNVIQSLIAIGSGGLMGKGFGRGTQANLQFLPAHWTDFIFASFAEEWGFAGVLALLTLYTILFTLILSIVFKTQDYFGKLLSAGVFFVIFIQFLINIGMNMGIMPVTGVTLPLMSYGGTSIVFTLIMLGICHNIWASAAKGSI